MKIKQLTKHIWISDYEEARDRPVLGYICTGNQVVAIDAGHSKEHVDEFYDLLKQNHLELPDYTILTHWHWDHTFGMHAISGMCIAEKRIQAHLNEVVSQFDEQLEERIKKMDVHVNKEYEHQKMMVTLADFVYENEMILNFKELTIQCFHVVSPHTDDAVFIYIPEEKVLFFGDAMCGEYPEWKIDKEKMKMFIEVVQKIDFELAVGGHWDPFTKEELLKKLQNDLQEAS